MAKFDLSKPLTALDGEPIKNQAGEYITAASIIVNALLTDEPPSQGNPGKSGEEKASDYDMAMRVFKDSDKGMVSLSVDEVVRIKNLVAKTGTTMAYGQLVQILDPKDEETPAE